MAQLHSMTPRLLIGLTGNIATGKSSVAQDFRELGAHVIDADQITHLVEMKGQPALAQIVAAFGAHMLRSDGELDRSALAQIVFHDEDKLRQLEAIVHPAVRAEIARRLAALPADAVAVIEVIKLFESGWADQCDQVWVTHCSPEEQVRRLMLSRGMSEHEARARVASQNPQADKLARADVVIDTSGTREETQAMVAREWARRVEDR
ncbi:MAG TPA: dephospho-CoA kinase [Anaerolineae bacterium]